jgi:hypothetical protein
MWLTVAGSSKDGWQFFLGGMEKFSSSKPRVSLIKAIFNSISNSILSCDQMYLTQY